MVFRFPITVLLLLFATFSFAQEKEVMRAPDRAEGDGPYSQLIIRGATLINGAGSPPIGPVDVVVEKNKITAIKTVGYPGVAIDERKRPKAKTGAKEIDATGMYLLPGLIDMHGHIGGSGQGTPAEYVFKLWMAHGITTIRDPSCSNGLEWVLDQKKKSDQNEITAPRIEAYSFFGQGLEDEVNSPEEARNWVKSIAEEGADGIKFFGARPDIMEAALDEAKKYGLRSACHHAQLNVAWLNALQTARMGLTSMEHWYGLPEAMFTDRTIQDYPPDYNYQNEQDRFGEAGNLWAQAAPPYSEKWNAVMDELIDMDFTIDPTFNIYEANRDLMRARTAEWHQDYTLPSLWDFFTPSRVSHGSHWHDWGTEQEVNWKKNYQLWMTFVNEYKNRGGRVTTGSDSGFIYQTYGFAYIRELELLREAGFHPLEVIRAATLKGAEALGRADELGSIEVGKLADMILVEENPLANLKVLYGTGAVKLNEKNEVERVGGVRYTIKDGIVYDAKQLLADVKKIVDNAKEKAGISELAQPGMKDE